VRKVLAAFSRRRNTSIEAEVYAALTAAGVKHERQKPLGPWVVDAYVPALGLVIECQGDFWHCNPAVYPDGPTYAIQRKGVTRDRQRFAWLAKRGYRVVEMWERDIRERGAAALVEAALSGATT
jgi:very-short-patch-repair endonuclease